MIEFENWLNNTKHKIRHVKKDNDLLEITINAIQKQYLRKPMDPNHNWVLQMQFQNIINTGLLYFHKNDNIVYVNYLY